MKRVVTILFLSTFLSVTSHASGVCNKLTDVTSLMKSMEKEEFNSANDKFSVLLVKLTSFYQEIFKLTDKGDLSVLFGKINSCLPNDEIEDVSYFQEKQEVFLEKYNDFVKNNPKATFQIYMGLFMAEMLAMLLAPDRLLNNMFVNKYTIPIMVISFVTAYTAPLIQWIENDLFNNYYSKKIDVAMSFFFSEVGYEPSNNEVIFVRSKRAAMVHILNYIKLY